MKKLMLKVLLLGMILTLSSCIDEGQGDKYNNLVVKDSTGGYFRLKWFGDDPYYVREIDMNQIRELSKEDF